MITLRTTKTKQRGVNHRHTESVNEPFIQNFKKFNSNLTQTTTSQLTYLNSLRNISQTSKSTESGHILDSIIQVRDISYHKSSTNSKGPETGNQIQGIEI